MATKVFYDNVVSTAKLADFVTEQSIETEILLADYEPQVFKIIKTTMEHSVTQKYIAQNKLVIEGFIKLCIYYQPPGGENLNMISQRIPFQRQLEINAEKTDMSCIKVTGNCQYVNTRPQNPTRIDVRGAYVFNIKLYGVTGTTAVTAIGGESVCCNNEKLEYFCMSGQNIRQFTIEDELDISEKEYKIIQVHPHTPSPTVTAYQDKVSAKGQVITDIYYTAEGGREVKKYTHLFLYNQVIDMQGVKENHIAYTDVNVTNIVVSQNTESKKITAGVTVQLDVTAFAKQQIIAVTDAYSRNFGYNKSEKKVMLDKNIYNTDKSWQHKFSLELERDCTVRHILFDVSPVKNYFEINKTTVKSRLNAYIIAENSQNEYESFAYSEDIVLPWLENCGQHDEISIRLMVSEYSCSTAGDKITVSAALAAQGFVIEKYPVDILENFEENNDNPINDKEEALVIYYGCKGEKIFDIAKAHCADPQLIMEENELVEDTLSQAQMIFIPVFD